jgi:hypothetical protein
MPESCWSRRRTLRKIAGLMPEFAWIDAATITSAILAGVLLLLPRVARDERWRATVTPLASIIGSGFLILGPLLIREYGPWAPGVMFGLCLAAYGFGAAVRANIRYLEPLEHEGRLPRSVAILERASGTTLTLAYVISVAYYLNLLGAFAVSLTPFDDRTTANLVTTFVLAFIGLFGMRYGLGRLERLEQGAVTLKLAMIAGLLAALTIDITGHVRDGSTAINPAHTHGIASLFVAFGLVITVQGFETSRYLGEEHDAPMRIRTMQFAQWSSTTIYMMYVLCMTWAVEVEGTPADETAIIGLSGTIAPILPVMLVAAALAAQFSAAVADTAGCGGLLHEVSRGRLTSTSGYVGVVVAGIALTWTSNVFEIISYGSRAFAVYYGLQSLNATILAAHRRSYAATVFFALLTLLATAIAALGIPAEGG